MKELQTQGWFQKKKAKEVRDKNQNTDSRLQFQLDMMHTFIQDFFPPQWRNQILFKLVDIFI